MDLVFLLILAILVFASVGLVAGCAVLERKK